MPPKKTKVSAGESKSFLRSVAETQIKAEEDFYSTPLLWGGSLLGVLLLLALPVYVLVWCRGSDDEAKKDEQKSEECTKRLPDVMLAALLGLVLLILVRFVWVVRNPKAAAQQSVAFMSVNLAADAVGGVLQSFGRLLAWIARGLFGGRE
ncbi:MAG: hypothetical protein CL862_00800 [Cyanobium sp. NAT70]|nr:hypothetical protein [Cyanobium sp. NAT70]|tara:strand:+ start:1163 stop:1612 length:450 start_codon:yes stop_codon:yes gene_type:complete